MKEIVFHQKLLEKAELIFKMTGPAMVQLASSDFWKVPYDFLVAWEQELAASSQHILLEHRLALLQKNSVCTHL